MHTRPPRIARHVWAASNPDTAGAVFEGRVFVRPKADGLADSRSLVQGRTSVRRPGCSDCFTPDYNGSQPRVDPPLLGLERAYATASTRPPRHVAPASREVRHWSSARARGRVPHTVAERTSELQTRRFHEGNRAVERAIKNGPPPRPTRVCQMFSPSSRVAYATHYEKCWPNF
jgi:hypothetical protein